MQCACRAAVIYPGSTLPRSPRPSGQLGHFGVPTSSCRRSRRRPPSLINPFVASCRSDISKEKSQAPRWWRERRPNRLNLVESSELSTLQKLERVWPAGTQPCSRRTTRRVRQTNQELEGAWRREEAEAEETRVAAERRRPGPVGPPAS